MVMDHVPVIDLSRPIGNQLGEAGEGIGFATLINHGIPPDLLASAHDVTARLFNFSDAVLSKYERPDIDRQRGFTGFRHEHAKGQTRGNLNRLWHSGREYPLGHPIRLKPGFQPNVWPEEVPEFRPVTIELFQALDDLSLRRICPPMNQYLGYPPNTLEDMITDGDSLLRDLHYPKVQPEYDGVRSSEHEDINFWSTLVAAKGPGLEVKTVDGKWVPVNETPGSIVFNFGDMMQMLTGGRPHFLAQPSGAPKQVLVGGRLLSTTHRVVNPPGGENLDRYAKPFFTHPRREVVLDKETGYTAGQFLDLRLGQNY